MKAIHATPKEIRKIFSDRYIIPDFQRAYSWESDQCEKLWEDLINFFETKKSREERYFLGNIVIHPEKDAFVVIDGQQRLTTLLLLIKSFHLKAGTATILEECLRIKDPLTSELTNELRLESCVVDDDKKILNDIIFNNGDKTAAGEPLKVNFELFKDKIEEWWKLHDNRAEPLNELILCLLDQVVILPIHCDNQDDALTIFETINDRGKPLNDTDIFKAKLYKEAGQNNGEVIDVWKELQNEDIEWYFRMLMHIDRAQEGDYSKEKGLRTYFTEKSDYRLSDWRKVLDDLLKIKSISYSELDEHIEILWRILWTYPNSYWEIPLFVFLHKYGNFEDDVFSLEDVYVDDLKSLIEYTFKYFYIKGIVYNSVNTVKDTVFRVCVAIEKGEDYIKEYQKNLSSLDWDEFFKKMHGNQFGKCLKGIILLASYLNPAQKKDLFLEFLCCADKCDVEHILPRKWNNYDGWDEMTHEEDLDTLGNLLPLEKKQNISASNEFFARKQKFYQTSKVQDAVDLLKEKEWTPETLHKWQKDKERRLKEFFSLGW